MADQYTPEEIQGIFEAYNNAIKSGTPITQDMANAMKDAEKGLKGYAKATADAQAKMGKGVVDFTKAMYKGEQGMSAMNGAVDALAGGLENLLLIIPGTALFRGAMFLASKAVGLFAEGMKTVNKQSDAVFKAYQDLSKSGAAAAGGMTEITANMQKLGYGLEQLDQMTAIIKENSSALASFGGTAASGTKAFADAASEIQRSGVGKSLMMLGKFPDDINRGMVGFIKNQQMLGVSSANINQNLAQKSAEYIKQIDILSKLTGEDAAQVQAKLEQARLQDAFAATQYLLQKKMDAGDADARRKFIANEKLAATLTGDALTDFLRGVGGDVSEMSKTFMTAPEAVAVLSRKAYDAADYLDALGKGAERNMDANATLAQFNATQDFLLPFHEMGRAASRYADGTAKQQEEMAKAQQELQQKGLDPATKAQIELRINQMKSRDSLQSFVRMGVNPATESLEALSKVTNKITGFAPGTIATGQGIGGGPANAYGGDQRAVGSSANAAAAMKFFQSAGYTKEQAAGIVGNLQVESGRDLNTRAVGDGGKAKGVAQWHPDRQAKFRELTGKDVMDATLEEQLKFVDWELKNTHKQAGDMLRQAKNAAEAAQLVDRHYEVSAGLHTAKRMASADLLAGPSGKYEPKTITRPSNSYDSKMASIKPNSTLPEKEVAKANQEASQLMAALTSPKSGFDNKLASIKPNSTLPEKEVAKANQEASRTDQTDELLGMLGTWFQSMDRRLANIDDNSKSTAQGVNR
jgi:hypothetical protein